MRYATPYRLGWPVLPDSFASASGESFSFSPKTPDATVIQALTQYNQALPPSLAAQWAAAQAGAGSSGASGSAAGSGTPSAAVTASGQPVSTQTAAAVTLVSTMSVAPGVWMCTMSDGSQHYCDSGARPISYTPPIPQPATTPAAGSMPTSTVSASVTPNPTPTPLPGSGPTVITASGQIISSNTGAPTSAPPVAAPVGFNFSGIMTWLESSMFGGVPNWLLVGGAAALMFMGDSSPSRGRR